MQYFGGAQCIRQKEPLIHPTGMFYYHSRHYSRSWDVVGKMNFLPSWSSYSGEDCLRLLSL